MTRKEYDIKDCEVKSIVWETGRQKDILAILDKMLENDREHPEWNVFENDSFYIEYADGTVYEKGKCIESGTYGKKGIKRIIYTNSEDVQVYGTYQVNEYGVVS